MAAVCYRLRRRVGSWRQADAHYADAADGALIRGKVEQGQFADASEVVDEALQRLEQREGVRKARSMLADVDAGIDRGEYDEWALDYLDRLRFGADEMDRQGLNPHADVCP